MDRAAYHVGAGGNFRQLPMAAHFHSKSQMTGGAPNFLVMSRKLLQQPNAQPLEEADSVLFVVLTVCGGVGLLILFTFGVMWCVYASKRRTRAPSTDGDESPTTDPDDPFTDEDKVAVGYRRGDLQRSVGYGAERKLAMSAQLYHYEKQKRELLALEQGNQNDPEPSPRGTPPPSYSSFINSQKARESPRDELAKAGSAADNARTKPASNSNSAAQRARLGSNGNEEEEFAVYEYPGLVTTVGQIEIDNPLFRAPNPHANDPADSGLLGGNCAQTGLNDAAVADADADAATLFGALPVQIVRQQPDLLASVDDAAALSASGSARKSKRSSKRNDTSSPSTPQTASSSKAE